MDRSTLASALDRVRVPPALLALRGRTRSPWVTVLTYHRAAELDPATLFDAGVVDVTPAQFDRQMGYLAKWFDVVGIEEMVAFRRGAPLPKNPVLVTFDDGYLDNHDTVLPILKKHGVRASFFIATSYIEERRLFWWDKINYLVKRSARDVIALTYPLNAVYTLGDGRGRALKALLRVVKDTYALDLPRFLAELGDACGVRLDAAEERRLADGLLMTWDHVRALKSAGMDVESHTRTHRVLQTVPDPELALELAGSRATLESVLGAKVRAVSYPVGKPLKYTPRVRNAVRAAGYEVGFSNGTGVNHLWDFDPLDAKRISLDAALSDAFFHAMVALPYLAY